MPCCNGLIIGVDASRNRSGGAVAHIRGLITGGDPRNYGISHVHLWGHDSILDELPVRPWLTKHIVTISASPILLQLAWQRWYLSKCAKQLSIDLMFNTDAGSVSCFRPSVTLSQDMLSFEPGEINRYPWPSRARIRLELLKYLQLKRLTGSDASIFLTNYAFKLINGIKAVSTHKIIHHGIDPIFFEISNYIKRNISIDRPVTCIYVSNAAPYKHQWVVIEAISRLREMTGLDIRLDLIGARSGQSASRVLVATERFDPAGTFVRVVDFLAHDEVPQAIAAADIFVFASSCENLPITLLEGMASGLPIACSDRGPMTEVLGDGGVFFDPENPGSISDAIGKIIFDTVLRNNISQVARDRARKFTWESCSEQTWKFLSEIARRNIVNAHV